MVARTFIRSADPHEAGPTNNWRDPQEMRTTLKELFTGITLSSEALAIVPKLAEWNSIFISSDNGDGRLTAESFVPNFFRANTSGPMGTRAVSLYLKESKLQKFYAENTRINYQGRTFAGTIDYA